MSINTISDLAPYVVCTAAWLSDHSDAFKTRPDISGNPALPQESSVSELSACVCVGAQAFMFLLLHAGARALFQLKVH